MKYNDWGGGGGGVVWLNTSRQRQDGRHYADDIFKWIFLNEVTRISFDISLKFILKSQIKNIPALVHIMAWRRRGDKPLSEPMLVIYWHMYAPLRPNELSQA